MNTAKNVTILVLLFLVLVLARAVIRLENYRYATVIGMCGDYNIKDPFQLVQRDKCLAHAQTRTNPLWHLYYALINH